MKLTHFRDLLAVVHTGSLRAASRHLGIAQPVITRSIREIENELGQSLLERHSKGVSLTPVGERFVRRIESVQAEIQRAKEEASQWNGDFTGEVSVGLSPISIMSLLPSSLSAFNRRYPKAVAKVTQTLFQPVEQKLAEGLMDFWVGSIRKENVSQRFTVEELMPHNRRIAGRVGHPLGGARSLEDLVNVGWVRPSLEDRSAESDLEATFKRLGLPVPEVLVESSSMLITIITVANTELLTVLPDQMFQLMPIAGFCAPLEHIPPISSDPICLVHRRGLPLTPLAEKLSDLLRKAAHNRRGHP
ncbi:LysR substrate-binding domain-containing protein [Niveispirillum sp.]|uniref:LysR substrate-binding domain-containing protein n=1 Tax=Niveispirillum sp. TaxID=1917217 RepID=UPI001B41E417|nr:LysR substrate-binding domain-containing protein [Niveispirillum sp.]MBP7335971.1 LysR family transcriptional regulator [Niveispirillum sp.]